MPEMTRPVRYSGTRSGLANRLRKLRDQTSSKNVVTMPNVTRAMKSLSSTAPRNAGTKLKPTLATLFK